MVSKEYEYSHVRRVRRVDLNTYEVVVSSNVGRAEVLICTVSHANGSVAITDISPTDDPQAVFDGRVDTRRVVADLVAYIEAEKSAG